MIKKVTYLIICLTLAWSCSTSHKTVQKASVPEPVPVTVPAPEGIEFKTLSNYKEFASIQVPIAGKEFKVATEYGDAPAPHVRNKSNHINYWSSINGFEGSLEEQFEKLKRAAGINIKEQTVVVFEPQTLGGYEVAHFDVYTNYTQGYGATWFGYLVKHGEKAAAFMVNQASLSPDYSIEQIRSDLMPVFEYMVKTVEFI